MDAFKNLRVLSFSFGAAGPYFGSILAQLGAEVIQVETMNRLDWCRTDLDPITRKQLGINACPLFNDLNTNKLSITLNLRDPRALDIAKRLIKTCDVMIESYSPLTIDRLGLSYDVVKEINPSIIMLSSSTSGRSGPEMRVVGYAAIFAAAGGFGELTGYVDGPPSEVRGTTDLVSAFAMTVPLFAALIHRQRTGEGQYIDYSSREAIVCCIGDSIMNYSMNGIIDTRSGNWDDVMVPHNCYRCKGSDKWVSIAVANDEEWQALCRTMGNPEWAKEEKFSNPLHRWENQVELDKLIEAWTMNYTSYEVMHSLQKAGVAARPSMTGEDMFSDPHLEKRKAYHVSVNPEAGARMSISCPWGHMSATPSRAVRDAPALGEHNEYIYKKILGLSSEEFDKLTEEKVFY